MEPKTRAYIYSIVTAVVPLLVAVGLFTGDIAAHVLNIAAAVLAVSATTLAVRNVTPEIDLDESDYFEDDDADH